MTVKEELLKTGAEMSKFDEALFIWRSEGKLHGFIGCHVDDFVYGGSNKYLVEIANLRDSQISDKIFQT